MKPERSPWRALNGDLSSVRLPFPDEVSALVLKAFATTVRTKPTDIVDVWRCLEICLGAGVKSRGIQPRSHGAGRSDHP